MKAIREGKKFNVLTGFRVWASKTERDTDASGDASSFTISFTDFGIPDDFLIDKSSKTNSSTESGAAALTSAVAAALVTFLLF